MLQDRRVKVSEITEAEGISEEIMRNILDKIVECRSKANNAKQLLEQFLDRLKPFHHYILEIKQHSKQWTGSTTKREKSISSAGNIMAIESQKGSLQNR